MLRAEITCIIAAFNSESTICETIESVLAQDIPCKIIVVDDGSIDRTSLLAQSFGDSVTVLSQHNSGPAAARNAGVDIATTEWVSFLDSDDLWLPGHLTSWSALRSTDASIDLYYCGAVLIDKDSNIVGNQTGHVLVSSPFQDLLESNWVPTSGAIFKKETFQAVGGFVPSQRHGEDWDLWLRIATVSEHWRRLPEDTIAYRQTNGSLSRNFDAMWEGINWALDRALAHPISEKAKAHEAAARGRRNFLIWLYWRTVAIEWRSALKSKSISRFWRAVGKRPVVWKLFLNDLFGVVFKNQEVAPKVAQP